MTTDGYDPDRLPEGSLVHGMEGITQELMMMYDLAELESSYLAFLMNIEGLAGSLIDCWMEQGKGDGFRISVETIDGLIDTIKWVRGKAETLIEMNKLL